MTEARCERSCALLRNVVRAHGEIMNKRKCESRRKKKSKRSFPGMKGHATGAATAAFEENQPNLDRGCFRITDSLICRAFFLLCGKENRIYITLGALL